VPATLGFHTSVTVFLGLLSDAFGCIGLALVHPAYSQGLCAKDRARLSALWNELRTLEGLDSRGEPVADIEQGYISTTSCILANLSIQPGRTLTWNPNTQRVIGDVEAKRLLRRPYRSPAK
jgi:hypothetical protein